MSEELVQYTEYFERFLHTQQVFSELYELQEFAFLLPLGHLLEIQYPAGVHGGRAPLAQEMVPE